MIWDGATTDLVATKTWLQHGLTWATGESRVALRTEAPHLVVLHATDGEGSGKSVHRVLTARGYSVHFVIERDGTIIQYLDPAERVAAHTGGLNARSVGIEIVCRQSGTLQPVPLRPRPKDEHIYQVVDGKGNWLKSKRAPCWGLYPEQLHAVALLVPALCKLMGVPATLADSRDYVPLSDRARLRGVAGHCQLTTAHADPPLAALNLFRLKEAA